MTHSRCCLRVLENAVFNVHIAPK